jgi:hypothetical protein
MFDGLLGRPQRLVERGIGHHEHSIAKTESAKESHALDFSSLNRESERSDHVDSEVLLGV